MEMYIKNINGVDVVLPRNKIIIKKKGTKTYNPNDEMLIEDGWKVFKGFERTIENIREAKINEIKSYDNSENINGFFINSDELWLDKSTRASLKMQLDMSKENGETYTTLWGNNKKFIMSLDTAYKILKDVQQYASECFNITQEHIAAVLELQNAQEIETYDFANNYPEKLKFVI